MSDERAMTLSVVNTLQAADFQANITKSLPAGVSVDRFTRAAITAIQNNPGIFEGDRQSLYLSILAAAQSGLQLDGKEAALVIFNTKQGDRWIKKVQYMPMVGGIIKNLDKVGVHVESACVYENDHFEYVLGDDPKIIHKPTKLGQPKGVMIGCYAILRRGNDVWREVMDSSQVEAVRAMSRAKDSLMWTQFASEGYRKTVVRRCAKLVPIQDEMIERTLRDDDETFDMGAAPAQAAAEPSADPTVVAQQAKVETTKAAKPKANGKARPAALAKALEQEDEQVPESENPAPAEKPAYEDPPHEGGADEDDIF